WNIHRCGVKQSEQQLSQDATGPFVLSGYSGYKQHWIVATCLTASMDGRVRVSTLLASKSC
ncbi:hypothetical protein CRUP_034201, partial [Coryphaenoides rupestris]